MTRTAMRSERGQRDTRSKPTEDRLSTVEVARELGDVAEAYRASLGEDHPALDFRTPPPIPLD